MANLGYALTAQQRSLGNVPDIGQSPDGDIGAILTRRLMGVKEELPGLAVSMARGAIGPVT